MENILANVKASVLTFGSIFAPWGMGLLLYLINFLNKIVSNALN